MSDKTTEARARATYDASRAAVGAHTCAQTTSCDGCNAGTDAIVKFLCGDNPLATEVLAAQERACAAIGIDNGMIDTLHDTLEGGQQDIELADAKARATAALKVAVAVSEMPKIDRAPGDPIPDEMMWAVDRMIDVLDDVLDAREEKRCE